MGKNGWGPADAIPYERDQTGAPERWVAVDQRALVERAMRGDHEAFASLVRVAFARLDTATRLILRDTELARDTLQEAMVRAWRDLPGLRDPDRFDAWLHRLTMNACLDAARHRRRRVIEVELTPTTDIAVPDGSGPRAERDELDAALRGLEPELRAIVVLHYYLELTLPETAHALGVPVGTVKSRLHRALAALRLSVSTVGVIATSATATQGRYA
jgi:RNA polymerase sigma-70 factor (ECF subfamily)